jgi:hypothetical protein
MKRLRKKYSFFYFFIHFNIRKMNSSAKEILHKILFVNDIQQLLNKF